jgi:excinuclease UvrABC nuclease subunit
LTELVLGQDAAAIDGMLEEIPNRPAVFLLWAREGKPYLARTNVLRRRLKRLLGAREKPSRLASFRGTVERVEYRLTGSKLEAQFAMWELARRYLGGDYRQALRLRFPVWVKLILSNDFPRTTVTQRPGRGPSLYFGPFRNRSTAAQFEGAFLDLFQLRRCQEDLAPSPEHPGCMYGEMGRCLRPCQMVVGIEEYRAEARRVADFLRTSGKSLLDAATDSREALSAEMDFEGAAAVHKRIARIEDALGLRDEMARHVDNLHAVAVLPSAVADAVEIGWLRAGWWQGFTRLEFDTASGQSVSLDARLREAAGAVGERAGSPVERMEQMAILSRWFYSSWRDGEMLVFDAWEKLPWRKLVNAVSRVVKGQQTPHPNTHSEESGSQKL